MQSIVIYKNKSIKWPIYIFNKPNHQLKGLQPSHNKNNIPIRELRFPLFVKIVPSFSSVAYIYIYIRNAHANTTFYSICQLARWELLTKPKNEHNMLNVKSMRLFIFAVRDCAHPLLIIFPVFNWNYKNPRSGLCVHRASARL